MNFSDYDDDYDDDDSIPTSQILPRTLEALAQIDTIVADLPYNMRGCVLDVLTALRGPDNPDQSALKESATNYIRLAAMPKTCQTAGAGRWILTKTVVRHIFPSTSETDQGTSHLVFHLYRAFKALGWVE